MRSGSYGARRSRCSVGVDLEKTNGVPMSGFWDLDSLTCGGASAERAMCFVVVLARGVRNKRTWLRATCFGKGFCASSLERFPV